MESRRRGSVWTVMEDCQASAIHHRLAGTRQDHREGPSLLWSGSLPTGPTTKPFQPTTTGTQPSQLLSVCQRQVINESLPAAGGPNTETSCRPGRGLVFANGRHSPQYTEALPHRSLPQPSSSAGWAGRHSLACREADGNYCQNLKTKIAQLLCLIQSC